VPNAKQADAFRKHVAMVYERLLGRWHYRTVDARQDWEEGLASQKRTPEQDAKLREAVGLNQKAIGLFQKGQPARAVPLSRRALALFKEVLGEKHFEYANCLQACGAITRAAGDHRAALPLSKQAVALQKEILGEHHPDYARGLHNLAALYREMGDHKAALPPYKKALVIVQEALGERHHHSANCLNSLAFLYYSMGDHKAALPLFKQALEVWKEVLGEKHPLYATGLTNLALLHLSAGNHKAALPLLTQALAINKAALGEKHPDYARNLSNLAALHAEMGDHKAALPLYEKALALRKEAFGDKHPLYAASLHHLARLHQDRGDTKEALARYQQALALRKEALGEKHPDYTHTLNGLAVTHAARGDHKAALPFAEKALALTVARLRDNASVQSDRQQLEAAWRAGTYLHNRLNLIDLAGHRTAAEHVLNWKGTLLVRQQQRRLFLRLAAGPATRRQAERLQFATRGLVALRASPTATRAQLAALEKEQEEAQAEFSRLSADFRATRDAAHLMPQALAEALPEGAVLVDYLFHGKNLTAFVHRHGKQPVRVDLGKAAPVAAAVRDWRALLVGKGVRPAGPALKKLVWSPLEKHLAGAKVVLVSPDGALGTVPFAALPGKKARSYLIEDVAVAVVPVPSAIPGLMKPVKNEDRLKPTLLVAGGLRYGPDKSGAPSTLPGREKFAALPATRAEIAAARASFLKQFEGGAVTSLSEDAATKAAVSKALPAVRYAHFATHGYFAPEEVRSLLGSEGPGREREGRRPVGWGPLLLSGIVLSGANREPKEGEEDGILTALEVSEMDLTKLELAVLSACETGLGKVAGGEGVLGMQRAFQVAGARTVIASLWQVDDVATRQLMTDFYTQAWGAKSVVGKAEALRQAQLAMLFRRTLEGKPRGAGKVAEKLPGGGKGERMHPYYWAGFVLSGDWR
jgi:CHAT domain-containing protein/Tfp pilus assembly protein PilF